MVSFTLLTGLLAALPLATSHIVMTYPGWRGDTLATTGSVEQTDGLNGWPAVGSNSTERLYPFGQQWEYPCGGIPLKPNNRTKWPVSGGAVAFQPGWFTGHLFGLIYVNLGFGNNPPNMSNPMVPPFQIHGPTNDAYPNQDICLPQVPLPAGFTPSIGDNATIQVVLSGQHGAALYGCVDITFADPHDPDIKEITEDNCNNSTEISFNLVVTTRSLEGAASALFLPSSLLASVPVAAALAAILLW